MPRPVQWPPSYRHHKSSGQAYIRIREKTYYLGRHGTPESKAEYARLVSQLANGPPTVQPASTVLTCQELCFLFLTHAARRWSERDRQYVRYRVALSFVRNRHGSLEATAFGPVALRACRDDMVAHVWVRKRKKGLSMAMPWSRTYINHLVGSIKAVWKWAVSEELLSLERWQALLTVPDLRAGEARREGRPVGPVPRATIDALLVHGRLTPALAALLELHWLTGCRSSEILSLRGRNLDTTGRDPWGNVHAGVWIFVPEHHKTEADGFPRVLALGPRAQALLQPWLRPDLDEYLFQPCETSARWHAEHGRPYRPGRSRHPGLYWTPNTYRQALRRACKRAGVPLFTPHAIRHSAATIVRGQFGKGAAQAHLGHQSPSATEGYAEAVFEAARIAREIG